MELPATYTRLRSTNVGGEPDAIAITPDGATAYVVSSNSGTGRGHVTPINTATNTAGPPIMAGTGSDAIAITADGKTAYVVDGGFLARWSRS
jgi:sugar lactone lactonase YvrE